MKNPLFPLPSFSLAALLGFDQAGVTMQRSTFSDFQIAGIYTLQTGLTVNGSTFYASPNALAGYPGQGTDLLDALNVAYLSGSITAIHSRAGYVFSGGNTYRGSNNYERTGPYDNDLPPGSPTPLGTGGSRSVAFTTQGLNLVSAMLVAANGCTTVVHKWVTVHPNRTVTVSGPSSLCSGAVTNFSASVEPATTGTYAWYANTDALGIATNPAALDLAAYAGNTAQVQAQFTTAGCTYIHTLPVAVFVAPSFPFTLAGTCQNTQFNGTERRRFGVQFTGSTSLQGSLMVRKPNGNQINVSITDGQASYLFYDSNNEELSINNTPNGLYRVYYQEQGAGCAATQDIEIYGAADFAASTTIAHTAFVYRDLAISGSNKVLTVSPYTDVFFRGAAEYNTGGELGGQVTGVQLRIENGARLVLGQNTNLFSGCGAMWKGVLLSNATLEANGASINHAAEAIATVPGSLDNRLLVTHCGFTDNYVGIHLRNTLKAGSGNESAVWGNSFYSTPAEMKAPYDADHNSQINEPQGYYYSFAHLWLEDYVEPIWQEPVANGAGNGFEHATYGILLTGYGNSYFDGQQFTRCWLAGVADAYRGTSLPGRVLGIANCTFEMQGNNADYAELEHEAATRWFATIPTEAEELLKGRYGILLAASNEATTITGCSFAGNGYYQYNEVPTWHHTTAILHLNQATSPAATTRHQVVANQFYGLEHGLWLLGGAYARPYHMTNNTLYDLRYCLKLDRSVEASQVVGGHSITYRCNQMRKNCAMESGNGGSEDWCIKNSVNPSQEGFVPVTYGIYLCGGAKADPVGICSPNNDPGDQIYQPGGNRWPVGNLTPDPTTGLSHLRSPYRWKSLWNENTGGTGLRYIRYYNEFVGTLFDDQGTEPIDAFGPTGTSQQNSDLGNTDYIYCTYDDDPFIAQYYDPNNPPLEPYNNGCFGDPNIYFPARPAITARELEQPGQSSVVILRPNPARDRIWMHLSSPLINILRVEFVQMASRKQVLNIELSPELNEQGISVALLPNGVYEVRMLLEGGKYVSKKLVVIH